MIRRTIVSNGVHWRTRFTARGSVVSDTESPRRGGDEGSVNIATVICRGPRMTIGPTVATTAIRAPPPWYGTFIRNTGG